MIWENLKLTILRHTEENVILEQVSSSQNDTTLMWHHTRLLNIYFHIFIHIVRKITSEWIKGLTFNSVPFRERLLVLTDTTHPSLIHLVVSANQRRWLSFRPTFTFREFTGPPRALAYQVVQSLQLVSVNMEMCSTVTHSWPGVIRASSGPTYPSLHVA